MLQFFVNGFEKSNEFFRILLSKVQFHPSYYAFLFPPVVTRETVYDLVAKKIFPTLPDLAPAFTYAIILSVFRFFLQHYVIKYLAEWCMKVKTPTLQRNSKVDKYFPANSKQILKEGDIRSASEKLNLPVRELKEYLWRRKRSEIINRKIVKFVEAFWRAFFYFTFTVIGYFALFVPEPVSWIVNTEQHWIGWPYHVISPAIKFYYHIQLGCYFHQLVWTEVSRSDSMEMISHHIITIFLLTASYLNNYTRVGSTILLIHDVSDIFLEVAKVFNYSSKPARQRWLKDYVVDPVFAIFAITFFITRLYIYPRYILRSVLVEGYATFGCEWGGCYFYVGLLLALQFLHVFWFYLIARMIFRLLFSKDGIQKDERSDDEEEEEEGAGQFEEETEKKDKKQ